MDMKEICADTPAMLTVSCVLDAGHDDDHSDGDCTTWSSMREVKAVRKACENVLSAGARVSGMKKSMIPACREEWDEMGEDQQKVLLYGYFAMVDALWSGLRDELRESTCQAGTLRPV